MKSKKLFLPTIILAIAVLAIAVCSVVSGIAQKPTVTEAEFPFSITYELDGETVTIEDVYVARYSDNSGYADTKSRVYVGKIGNMSEDQTVYTLKEDENGRIELCTHFYAEYMMGDAAEYNYFDEEPFEPGIYYYDAEEIEYHDAETLQAQGVKLISFEYPEPIENSFVFSHISYLSGAVVPVILLVAVLAMLAVIIFVKKEKELVYKAADKISVALNFLVGLLYVPMVSILSVLIDMEGGGPELYYQIMYFIPSFSVLCIAASIALRRKGYGVKSLIATLIGPAVFAIYLLVFSILLRL